MLNGIRRAVQAVSALVHPHSAPAPAQAAGPTMGRDAVSLRGALPPDSSAGQLLKLAVARPGLAWQAGAPLSEGRNAHRTNTVEEMREALTSDHGYNWLEGDVRREINDKNKIELRHDEGHEAGDNLTLTEWLTIGKASGRGLKLDIKDAQAVPGIISQIKAVGLPQARLMLNLGYGAMEQWGPTLRREFPEARLALNPADSYGGRSNPDGPYQAWQVDDLIAQAKRLGDPVTFVLRVDRVTPEAVKRLEAVGPVSIWNAPSRGGLNDVEGEARKLRDWGVSGVVDLRPSMSLFEKARAGAAAGLQMGKNLLRKGWEAIF